MMKKTLIQLIILLIAIPSVAQKKQETVLKREVTLYNPYKPSLPDVVKKGYLPDMTDTAKVRPDFKYDVKTNPFMPSYNISSIKPATLIPDPLPKLYNSYVKFGLGNYVTPLAEISITSKRSKNGTIGAYARHFSTNGKVELQNLKKAFAGYMDNDASVYGRRIFPKSVFESSVDFSQKTRYAYGYDTAFTDYEPRKKDIRLSYYNIGTNVRLVSTKLDSSDFAYDFNLAYNFFHSAQNFYQNSIEFKGLMAKSFKGFYMGSGLEYDYYKPSDSVSVNSKYIFALSPFIKKSSAAWSVRLGAMLVIDKGLNEEAKLHIYPDLNFSFSIVPDYVGFFAALTGRLEKNTPLNVIGINPFILPNKVLFDIPNTDYSLIVKAGLTGETGIDGNYQLSASYSIVNNMLLFSNYIRKDTTAILQKGNYFVPAIDQAEILNFHGEIGGKISDKLSFGAGLNYYRYTLSNFDYAWNKPDWDATLGLKYNLRDKIIADLEVNALGMRRELVTTTFVNSDIISTTQKIDIPWNLNFSLGAEYRYTKVLSFWLKFNNMTFSRYFEWAYYPSLRFMCMVGFTYSL
jgi:hypothetical protein